MERIIEQAKKAGYNEYDEMEKMKRILEKAKIRSRDSQSDIEIAKKIMGAMDKKYRLEFIEKPKKEQEEHNEKGMVFTSNIKVEHPERKSDIPEKKNNKPEQKKPTENKDKIKENREKEKKKEPEREKRENTKEKQKTREINREQEDQKKVKEKESDEIEKIKEKKSKNIDTKKKQDISREKKKIGESKKDRKKEIDKKNTVKDNLEKHKEPKDIINDLHDLKRQRNENSNLIDFCKKKLQEGNFNGIITREGHEQKLKELIKKNEQIEKQLREFNDNSSHSEMINNKKLKDKREVILEKRNTELKQKLKNENLKEEVQISKEKAKELGRNLPIREKQKQEKEREENRNEILRKETRKERAEQIWNDPETEVINSDMLKLNNESNDIDSIRTEINKVELLKESIKEELNQEDLREGLKVGLKEDISKDAGGEDLKNLKIPEDLFYKEKNGFHCKDVNLLKKIYETQKSFLKIELFLKNQDCKKVPSSFTLRRLVQKSFKSIIEYNNWRSGIMLKEYQDIAKYKEGKCLSTEYKNNITKLRFRCKKGHEFEANPNDVKSHKSWCPICMERKKLTLKEIQDIAKERGGKCLSSEYKNNKSKLKFRCKKGHEFEITPTHLKGRDQWCPICSERTGETICRGVFEAIFNKDFKKARPEWLKNSEGNQLELDGYNAELNLAFERQGEQHYKFPNIFHKTLKGFVSQLSNDQDKGELCDTHGVTLIEVPYWIKYDEYQDYIIKQCKIKGIEIPEIEIKIDWKKFKWDTNDENNRSLKEWV